VRVGDNTLLLPCKPPGIWHPTCLLGSSGMAASDDLLRSIDTKLAAILALTLDNHQRQTGVARPKERSVDKILSDAGLSSATIASLLGKTDRAVNLQLQREAARKSGKAKRKTT
jgi:hypothetical protein